MPIATVVNASERFELESLPEAFVVVRRMTYGESLKRDAMSTKFLVGGQTDSRDVQGQVEMQTEQVALWDFANCIMEHNLTDENDRLLNFKNAADVRRLSKPIGAEIGEIIDRVNSAEKSDEVKN